MYRPILAMLMVCGAVASAQAQNGASAAPVDRASAYYHYTLAHMYADLAGQPGVRGNDYVNKAIENYKEAIKADPETPLLSEELSELYVAAGRLREAENDANEALKQNPNDLNALRLLARMYTRQIVDQQNRVDESMLHKAIDEYQKITKVDPKDTDSWLMLGRLQKSAQNSVEAQNAYQKVLDIDPDNEDALTGLATIEADLGDTKSAAAILQKLAQKNPNARSLRALAAAYEQMHEYALAAETAKRLLDMNPPDASDVKHELAQYQTLAEQYQAALQTYGELVADEPNDAEAYLHMSQIYTQLKDYAKAREASDKAAALEPDNLDIRYNLVRILEAQGKTSDAIQLLKDIVDSTAKRSYNQGERMVRAQLLERLAGLYIGADQTTEAVDTLRQIGDLDPSNAAHVSAQIIETLDAGKEYAKAEQEADAAVKKYPSDRDVRLARASLLAEMGKSDAAVTEAKRLLNGTRKDDLQTYEALAEVYEKGKHWEDASKALDSAEKLAEEKEEKEDVWFRRGALYEKWKKVDLAEKEFRKVLDGSPKNALALNYLGYMLADRNMRLQEALQYISQAIDLDPNNGAILDSLGWVYYKLGRNDEAEQNLRRAVELTPRDPTVHDHFAEVLMKQSKVKDAINQWQISLKEWNSSSPTEMDPGEIAKVKAKLETAKVRLAKEGGPDSNKP